MKANGSASVRLGGETLETSRASEKANEPEMSVVKCPIRGQVKTHCETWSLFLTLFL
jgi:hypothetical protein